MIFLCLSVCLLSRRGKRARENRMRIDSQTKKKRKINAWTHVWRNIQLLFIDTHIFIHWFIDDGDDDNVDDDIVATKKDYIKNTNSYINIYAYICVCRGKKRTTLGELVVECCVITMIQTLYILSNTKCMWRINHNIYMYIHTQFYSSRVCQLY